MSQDPVSYDAVIEAAIQLAEPTFLFFVAFGGYALARHMVITEGLIQKPYVNEIMGVATLALIVLISILVFAWGFVGYLALEYLANKKEA